MNQLACYAAIEELCGVLLVHLAEDDPDPELTERHLEQLATWSVELEKLARDPAVEVATLLQAATTCARLSAAVSAAAAHCRERLREAQARSERAQQAVGAYISPKTPDGPAQFIDQQR